MPDQTYTGVTEAIFQRIKSDSESEHGTTYDPQDGDVGVATTKGTPFGDIVMQYALDPTAETLAYTLEGDHNSLARKVIFSKLGDAVDAAKKGQ